MKLNEFLAKLLNKANLKNKDNLLSFSPQKYPNRNSYIVNQIKKATSIFNKYDNNIALEGAYGTGKSSILRQLKETRHWQIINRSKTISFFSFSEKGNISNIEIQSEIVRQLYFGEKPNKLKGSGYKRIGKHYIWISILLSSLLSITLVPNLLGTNMMTIVDTVIDTIRDGNVNNSNVTTILAWSLPSIFIALLSGITLNILSGTTIESVSAKDLSIKLLDKNLNFNQLIDLLIFYFKKTKRRVLIFEDLDRFDRPEIFEELRQLNFVLNNRLRLFGKVKFIYAIKDDLFSKDSSENENETEPTSSENENKIELTKTKVFDLIIPVIPFLAETNYDTIFQDEYKKADFEYDISGIEKILSRHTSDMRVVKAFINNLITYTKTFKLKSEKDYKNCASLAIIRLFEPNEFKKIPTGNSSLDTILESCHKYKRDKLKEIETKYTINSKIKNHSDSIWSALRAYGTAVPINHPLQNVTIGGETISPTNAEILTSIYHAKADIQINWTYQNKQFTPDQIKEIFNPFVIISSQEQKTKEIETRKIAEDSFKFYDNIENKPKIPEIICELIENGFITEDYLRFTARTTPSNINVNRAKRYIFNFIRGQERDASYYINGCVAEKILSEIDNTDLSSTGLYNYNLFDYVIKNNERYTSQLTRILTSSKADSDRFMDFFNDYCRRYENELESRSHIELDEAAITKLSKIVPPVFLTMQLAKMYPKELMTKIAQSPLASTDAKRIIYSIAIASLENPQNLTLDEQNRTLLKCYADTILKNKNGRENLFKLFIANSIFIDNLEDFTVSNNNIKNYLDKILITINEQNLAILDEDVLIDYLSTRQLSTNDFTTILESDKLNVKQYIVKNIEKITPNDDLPKCLEKAATYISEKKISLTASELLQYAGRIDSKKLIEIILIANLAKEEIVEIMSKCNDGNLNKIQDKNSLIKLATSKNNIIFTEKLELLGLVSQQKGRKDKKTIWLQVL